MDKPLNTVTHTILISAGGTGGGIYPALAVLEALRRVAPEYQLHFVGSADGMEQKLVPRDQIDAYHAVQSGPLHGVSLVKRAVSAVKIGLGVAQAWGLAGKLKPSALFLTGGWATFPVAVGCWLRRVPVIVYLPDIEPALVIKTISRLARLVMTPTDESAAFFPRGVKTHRVGYPLRAEVLKADRAAAIAHFGLDPARKTLLVWGGSRGARSINEALITILPDLLADELQIIHVSGELDWPNVQARRDSLPEESRRHYHAFAYLRDDMGLALAAADLAVSRAGASSLGEYPHFGLPAILVPYPFAWRYQKTNADWLVQRGAARRMDDEAMSRDLLPTIRALFGDSARLEALRRAALALAGGDVADTIARQVIELAKNTYRG